MPMVDATAEINKASYPGLIPQAADLWRKFLALYADKFQTFEYNVRVGQGLDPGPGQSDAMRAMWKAVTTKRIDVVANRENQTWVIEIEERPGMRTLGQLVGYMGCSPNTTPRGLSSWARSSVRTLDSTCSACSKDRTTSSLSSSLARFPTCRHNSCRPSRGKPLPSKPPSVPSVVNRC